MNPASVHQIQQHFRYRGEQQQAAAAALEQVRGQRGTVDPTAIQDWLRALWTDGDHGPISAEVAARALNAFCDRPALPTRNPETEASFRPGPGGLAARSYAKDDGRDWKAEIDRVSTDAKATFVQADLEWLFALDLRKPDDFRAFGKWAGWRVDDAQYQHGSSWQDPTVQHWLRSTLRSRYLLPSAVTRDFIEHLRDDVPRFLPHAFVTGAKAGSEREAVFEAFLRSLPILLERLSYGRTDETALRRDLEQALGLEKDSIPPFHFELMLEEFPAHRGREFEDLDDYVGYLKKIGYTQEIFLDHVLQEPRALG